MFTAYIILREGHDVTNIDITTATCERAIVIREMVNGDLLVVKCKSQDVAGAPII